jgi:hypothetical protein
MHQSASIDRDEMGFSLAILGRAEPGKIDHQQLVELVCAVIFPRIEADLQLFGIACWTTQTGEYLELISDDIADVVLTEYLLQLFIQRLEVALPELHYHVQSRLSICT